MVTGAFDLLKAELSSIEVLRDLGRVEEVMGGAILVSGLNAVAALGDRIAWRGGNTPVFGEVIRLTREGAWIMLAGPLDGVSIGDRVDHMGAAGLAPHDGWLGRIIDPYGRALDGKPLLRGPEARALLAAPPPPAQRRGLGARVETGLCAFNTVLPIVRGQRIGLFAGSGVGKTRLLTDLARGLEADVVVVAMVGERGREVREFSDQVFSVHGRARTVVVAATSDESPLTRRRCLLAATSVAEHFRDQGLHVLLLADSITRFAEAHREVAFAAGETGSLRGYPPSISHAIMGLAERAGPGTDYAGDITAVFTVLVAGSDMEGAVADILRGVLDGHVVLDREIAERGRFPAINLLRSISRSLPDAASEVENAMILKARQLLGAYDRAETMIQAGLYAAGSDAAVDQAMRVWEELDSFLALKEPKDTAASFAKLASILEVAQAG